VVLSWALLAAIGTPVADAATSQERAGVGVACLEADQHAEPPEPAGLSPSDAVRATLVVRVQQVGRGGAAPRAAQPPRPPLPLGPGAGAPVQIVATDAPAVVVAEGLADAAGQATFPLPSGRYWVFVPWEAAVPGVPAGSARGGNRPDGRPILAWAEAALEDGGVVEIPLHIGIALP
jgi:hypothetical protein